MRTIKIYLSMIAIVLIVLSGLTSCASQSGVTLNMAPMSGMPAMVHSAPRAVQEAYQFAAANPEVTDNIPCYCGCDKIGHKSNYDCYISAVDSSGELTFDSHAISCSICVEITQDAMRLVKEGQSVPNIRAYIDENYSKYGASTMP